MQPSALLPYITEKLAEADHATASGKRLCGEVLGD
jgi:hypothetical protein